MILPAFLTEDTEKPPIFQKEHTLYDDGVFFGGLETITCKDGNVQGRYQFFDKIGVPQHGQFRIPVTFQKEEENIQQLHQTKTKELLQEAGICEIFVSPPVQTMKLKGKIIPS